MSQANRIDHECVAVDSLVQYLKQRCGHQDIQVQKEENDPPDFWLSIDGSRFAVEETSIATEDAVKRIAIDRKKGMNSGSLGLKWEGEVQDELAELIQKAVRTKREKLERKGVPQRCRDSILLLYDAHGFGDPEDAKLALQQFTATIGFILSSGPRLLLTGPTNCILRNRVAWGRFCIPRKIGGKRVNLEAPGRAGRLVLAPDRPSP